MKNSGLYPDALRYYHSPLSTTLQPSQHATTPALHHHVMRGGESSNDDYSAALMTVMTAF